MSNLNVLELMLGKDLDDQDLSIWTLTLLVVLQGLHGCEKYRTAHPTLDDWVTSTVVTFQWRLR